MIKKTNISKAELGWLLKMAWRDGKASWKKLTLFMASIVLGIAALVSIQSFSDNLKNNIASQSKSLMGSDFKIDSDKPPSDSLVAIMDSLGGFNSREISFTSMVAFPRQEGSKLGQVRGIEGKFPFYGTMETEPATAATSYQDLGTALVDATLMLQF